MITTVTNIIYANVLLSSYLFRLIPGSFTFPTINEMTMLFHDLKKT